MIIYHQMWLYLVKYNNVTVSDSNLLVIIHIIAGLDYIFLDMFTIFNKFKQYNTDQFKFI